MLRRLLTPRWIAGHLLALAAVVAFVAFGFWQLDRHGQKQDIKAAAEQHPELRVTFKDAGNDTLKQRAHVEEFVNAGDREWGGKMQDDISDGVAWLLHAVPRSRLPSSRISKRSKRARVWRI